MAANRRRIYNPAHLTPDELKESFVAREDTLAELLRVIREQTPGRPCQHMILIGARGMGKTTLGLRFLYAIEEDPDLRERWQPVAFHEESYGIGSLADFWIHALRHLTRATGESRWEQRAEAFVANEADQERAAAYALAELADFNRESERRLILFVENFDSIVAQIHDEREIHSLRATLIERSEILLLGSANAYFESIGGYGEPLYEFFRVFKLDGIGQEDARRILEAAASSEGRPEVSDSLNMEQGRLETIRRLTGGNPRLLALACRLLIESPLGSAVEDLERLIDEQTPYFKARIEDLPGQARKVFHCLSEGWKPLLAKEVATAARLSSSHASAQLKQLTEKGYTREIRLSGAKRTRYEVSDRFYNIYYLLRFSRSGRDRLERFIGFLHDLFGTAGMRTMYVAVLASLRTDGVGTRDGIEWLPVLARRVAADQEFVRRNDWLTQAVDIIVELFGPKSRLIGEIKESFQGRLSDDEVDAQWIKQTDDLIQQGRVSEAEQIVRNAQKDKPRDPAIWSRLSTILIRDNRFEEALSCVESASKDVGSHDHTDWKAISSLLKIHALWGLGRQKEALETIESAMMDVKSEDMTVVSRFAIGCASLMKGEILFNLSQTEEAIQFLLSAFESIREDDHWILRRGIVEALVMIGDALAIRGRNEQAVSVRARIVDYVHSADPEELRRVVARGLVKNTTSLRDLGRYNEVGDLSNSILDCVGIDDSAETRRFAPVALLGRSSFQQAKGQFEHLIMDCQLVLEYIQHDDPKWLLTMAAGTLALSGRILIELQRYSEADDVLGKAIEIDQEHAVSWAYRARSVLREGEGERISEAEEFARRAAELDPDGRVALYTLSDVLSRRGNWLEAMDRLEQALRSDQGQPKEVTGKEVVDLLIRAAAAGHGARVKRIMDETGLAKSMEPLWHAVRAELGEELEALPTEVMDAVVLLRRRIGRDSTAAGSFER